MIAVVGDRHLAVDPAGRQLLRPVPHHLRAHACGQGGARGDAVVLGALSRRSLHGRTGGSRRPSASAHTSRASTGTATSTPALRTPIRGRDPDRRGTDGGVSTRAVPRTTVAVRAAPDRSDWCSVPGGRLRRSVLAELCLALAILAVTALLVNAVPAKQAAELPFSTSFKTLGVQVNSIVSPARVGPVNQIHVYILSSVGTPKAVPELDVTISLPSESIGPLAVPLVISGPGHYYADNLDIPVAGTGSSNSRSVPMPSTSRWSPPTLPSIESPARPPLPLPTQPQQGAPQHHETHHPNCPHSPPSARRRLGGDPAPGHPGLGPCDGAPGLGARGRVRYRTRLSGAERARQCEHRGPPGVLPRESSAPDGRRASRPGLDGEGRHARRLPSPSRRTTDRSPRSSPMSRGRRRAPASPPGSIRTSILLQDRRPTSRVTSCSSRSRRTPRARWSAGSRWLRKRIPTPIPRHPF